MFDTLIVSRPQAKRAWRRELAGPTFSLAVHSLILYAAAVATTTPPAGNPNGTGDTSIVYVGPQDQPPSEPPVPAVPKVFRTLLPPVSIPRSIPSIDPTEVWDPGSFGGVGRELGPYRGVEGPTDLTQVFIEDVVDQPPECISFPPPEYPRALLAARIEGTVVLEAVIDTLGHSEPGSIRVISSTNPGFEAPARAAFRGALYRAGRLQGQKVRVLVHQPLKFALPR